MVEAKPPRWIAPVLICLVAFALRVGPLWVNRFHPDEALYASWAMAIAYGRDVLLAQAVLDKPPLPFYLMAVFFLILGRAEIAARLISLTAGLVSVALLWHVARKLKISPPSAALALALAPFAILFSSTAFLDPLMVMCVVAALAAATFKRPGWAGAWLALAAATKLEAVLFFPLVVFVGTWVHGPRSVVNSRFIRGLVIPATCVLVWELARSGSPFWINLTVNYGGTRPIYAGEVLPRLAGWARLLPYLLGWPALIVLALGLPLLGLHALTRGARTRAATLDLALIGFTLGYLGLVWLFAVPIWDRYLLGLAPVMSLLAGRLAGWLSGWGRPAPRAGWIATLGLAALMVYPASQATTSALPIGGDHGAQDGIDRVTDYVRSYPYGTVLYDHWLGWSLRYYLWDATAYVAYFDTPEWLANDLRVFGRASPRLIIFPAAESTTRIERALAAQGFTLAPLLSTRNRHGQPTFQLYQIDAAAP